MQPRDERNSLEKRPFQREVVIIHPVVSTLKVVWCQSACIYVYLTVKYSYAYVWNTCHIIYSACMSIYIYILCNYVLDIDIYIYDYTWHICNDISINHPHTMDWLPSGVSSSVAPKATERREPTWQVVGATWSTFKKYQAKNGGGILST